MRLSRYFLPILRETPKEAEIVSHRLMLRAGLVRQESAGIYAWLPAGLRVLNKINAIIREEQNRSGAVELLMPTIQSADLWRESGRYEAYGKEMLRIKDRHERDMLFGPTNEEMITEIFRAYVRSYKDLPLNLYHIQWKFRDEVRPRFGVMRSREFLMKDAYSFDLDQAGARHSYNRMFVAYLRTFQRLGLTSIPMRADTGPIGGDLSHEFIILASTGESEVFCDRVGARLAGSAGGHRFRRRRAGCRRSSTPGPRPMPRPARCMTRPPTRPCPDDRKVSARGIEVGHIFYFGTKYSEPMRAVVDGPDGQERAGSHGLLRHRPVAARRGADRGVARRSRASSGRMPSRRSRSRCSTSRSATAAPMRPARRSIVRSAARGIDVLYDDREERPGAKFATADLVGMPWQVIVGPKGLAEGKVELKRRATGERTLVSVEDAVASAGGLSSMASRRQPARQPDAPEHRPFALFEWMVALRYLRARRREGFISVIAGFSFAGIMLGVATLIIVMSVMNGFRSELLNKIVGINGHIFVGARSTSR